MKKTWLALLVLSCAKPASNVAAVSPSPSPRVAPPAEPRQFAQLAQWYAHAKFAYEPSFATAYGVHNFDDKVEDRSRARIDARLAELKAQLAQLSKIDRSKLPFGDAIDFAALEASLNADVHEMEVIRNWERSPIGYAGLPGATVDSLCKRNFAPAAQRLKSVIARLKGVPAIYAAAKENVKNPPKEFTDLAIRVAKGSVGFFKTSLPTWAKEPLAADPSLKAEFETANQAAIVATSAYAKWLEKELLPKSKGSYAIGADAFLAKLKHEEMVEMPLPELLARGEAQLEKDRVAFQEVAKKIDAKKTPAQVMKLLSNEFPKADELIPSVQRSVDEARQYLVEKDLVTLPSEVRPIIAETPVYARAGSFASMETPGPDEKVATEAYYYVTPVEKDWDKKHQEEHLRLYNPYVTVDINVHEAYPGHYLQFLYAKGLPTLIRRLVATNTNAEGWAHYAEQMMIDEGFHASNAKYALAQLQEALLRDCRYVVGIKLHTEGWTVEQGAKFMVEKGYQESANAYEEARRGTYDPTYLYYTFGKLEIQRMRDEYLQKNHATLKQFHDAFLAAGALHLPLTRKLLFETPVSPK